VAEQNEARRSHLEGTLGILSVAALWGSTFPVMKLAFSQADPMPFLALRFAFASLGLWAAIRISGAKPKMSREGLAVGVLVFLGFALQLEGLAGTSATKSAFITGLNVPIVPLIEYIAFRRRLKFRAALAIALGLLGLSMLTEAVRGITPSRGDVLTLGCAVLWALQIVAVDRLARDIEPASLALNQALPTLCLALIVSPLLGERNIQPSPPVLGAAAYTGLMATAAAFSMQAWAQRRIPPELAALGLLSILPSASLAPMGSLTSTSPDSGVSSGLTSISFAPLLFATKGISAAGYTTALVPMTSMTLAELARLKASNQASSGSGSPNQTTSGLSSDPHSEHLGGISTGGADSSLTRLHPVHLARVSLPWSSTTLTLPALKWRPSTF